jgi:hypothetical protein
VKRQLKGIVFAALCIFPVSILATTFYVDPNYKANGLAKIDAAKYGKVKNMPLPNIFPALNLVQPGDSVLLAGGTHRYTQSIDFTVSGAPDKPITIASYPGDTAVLDFSAAPLEKAAGVTVTASALAFNNIVYENASKHGCIVSGNNGVYTQCIFRNNGDKGCQVLGSHNQFVNCDAYGNGKTDAADGDGFAPQLEDAGGNKFVGCRAYNNGDDGWDGYLKDDKTITDTLVNCWAISNGYDMQGNSTAGSGGNGNGFKPGSATGYHNWVEINCLAAYNQQKGFDQNHSIASMTLINCTSFNNYKWNICYYESPASGHTCTIKNCITLRTSAITPLSPLIDTLCPQVVQSNNSWLTGFGPATAADFGSVDTAGLRGPRKSDGSLPDVKCMHLASGSKLVDAGVSVTGITTTLAPFKGKAPDLGCFESSFTSGASGTERVAASSPWQIFSDANSLKVKFPSSGYADIAVYTIGGQRVVNIAHRTFVSGDAIKVMDFNRESAGTYICSVKYNGTISTQTIVRN